MGVVESQHHFREQSLGGFMRRSSFLILVASLSGLGTAALADETAEVAKPSTCYVSANEGVGQITCLNEQGEPSALEAVAVTVESSDPAALPTESLRFTISGAAQIQHAFGVYELSVGPAEILTVGIKPIIEGGDFKDLVTPIRYARGGVAYRGGGVAYRRGGAVAYRGGGYRRGYGGAAVVGGAIVGGAVGAAASGGYCDPNYYNCSGYGYGGGYYAPGVAAGAVVGGAVAAGAYRGGAYRRGGAVAVRRGGAVAYRGGGRRR
jgi:hypothetical protein